MDMHHVSGVKEFNISSALTSWERILPELEKCVLLCSRCHRETHDGLHPQFLELDGSQSMYDLSWDDELEGLNS